MYVRIGYIWRTVDNTVPRRTSAPLPYLSSIRGWKFRLRTCTITEMLSAYGIDVHSDALTLLGLSPFWLRFLSPFVHAHVFLCVIYLMGKINEKINERMNQYMSWQLYTKNASQQALNLWSRYVYIFSYLGGTMSVMATILSDIYSSYGHSSTTLVLSILICCLVTIDYEVVSKNIHMIVEWICICIIILYCARLLFVHLIL